MIHSFTVTFGAKYLTGMVTSVPPCETFSLIKNNILHVPIYYLAKPQPRERAWQNQRGKKTLLSLTLVRLCEET